MALTLHLQQEPCVFRAMLLTLQLYQPLYQLTNFHISTGFSMYPPPTTIILPQTAHNTYLPAITNYQAMSFNHDIYHL